MTKTIWLQFIEFGCFQWRVLLFLQHTKLCSSNLMVTIWWRPLSVPPWLSCAQNQLCKDMVDQFCVEKLACPARSPVLNPTWLPFLGWIGMEIASWVFWFNASTWPHKWSLAWTSHRHHPKSKEKPSQNSWGGYGHGTVTTPYWLVWFWNEMSTG